LGRAGDPDRGEEELFGHMFSSNGLHRGLLEQLGTEEKKGRGGGGRQGFTVVKRQAWDSDHSVRAKWDGFENVGGKTEKKGGDAKKEKGSINPVMAENQGEIFNMG